MDSRTLARDELIGLHVRIKECTDPTWKDVTGRIIDETKNTFLIETLDGKQKRIEKKTAEFEFNVNGEKIIINGSKIAYRPEDRIKKIR